MTVEERIEVMHGWANESRLILYNLEDDIDTTNINIFWNDGTWRNNIKAIIDSIRDVLADHIEASQHFVYGQTSSFNYTYWRSLHLELLPGELSWESIVEAWIADDFEGRAVTIATIDRMRQILWNEPFSVIWAARPENIDI